MKKASAAGLIGLTNPIKAQAGTDYFVPAEERPHHATFMQWPVNPVVYRDPVFLSEVQNTIANIANTIADFEPVILLAAQKHHSVIRSKVTASVDLWNVNTDDLWCRDSGPVFVVNGAGDLAIRDIRFNGWGNKQPHRHDAKVASRVAQHLGVDLLPTPLIGEAGGVEQDGAGLLMAHESSWINPNRNPDFSRYEIEEHLLKAYGAQRMIWSKGVYGEDITDYHIDSLARFTGPGRVLINLPDAPDMQDPFHLAALETYEVLVDANLRIDIIPEPNRRRINARGFVASYANYYLCNGALIMAQFGDKQTDDISKQTLKQHFPDREIVAMNVDILGELGGGIHCATQQMPKT